MEYDFSGYASKSGMKCTDGRTIEPGAFKHQSGIKVPLVWQHQHNSQGNVLGHGFLENRADGTYVFAKFNETEAGKTAKILVQSGDVDKLSIYANQLVERSKNVTHGNITEVSLVLAGANPGAFIDYINLQHGDDGDVENGEAVIYTDNSDIILMHSEETEDKEDIKEAIVPDETLSHTEQTKTETQTGGTDVTTATDDKEKTVEDVLNSMTQEQRDVVAFLVGDAEKEKEKSTEMAQSAMKEYKEGFTVGRNAFDQTINGTSTEAKGATLSHAQIKTIFEDAQRTGSLKESFLAHIQTYGIENLEVLFPDAVNDGNGVSLISRRTEWVAEVLGKSKHIPFSRIKSFAADLTADAARAKGYVKGNLKKEEIIKMLKRVTTPTTIYKKQKLDRDDIIDITELDIVTWLKGEMRLMLDEELARAILVGDGREPDDDDKINEDHLRPIAYDIDMYAHKVNFPTNTTPSAKIEAIVRARRYYKGTGTPTLYTTDEHLTDLILDKDSLGRRYYSTEAELSAALRVDKIVVVEVMESYPDIFGIIVNMADYTIGADKGGAVSLFDDFDIDYNAYKYLIETRASGALTKPKSAVILTAIPANVITPAAPTFVPATGVVTIPSTTGATYRNASTLAVFTAGPQTAIAPGSTVEVEVIPGVGYAFPHGFDNDFTFTRPSA